MTTKADIKIDYDHSILSISNSLLQHFNVEHKYKSLSSLDNILAENYKNVVLLILDGMGIDIMKKNRMFEIVKYNKKLQKRRIIVIVGL